MQAGPNTPNPTIDPLHLDRCPDCGYLLTGLPDEGQCPECSFSYNTDMIVLYGWGIYWPRWTAQTPPSWLWFFLGSLPMGISLFVTLKMEHSGNSTLWLDTLLLVLLVLLSSLPLLWRYVRLRRLLKDAPAILQVRLQPEGFAQREGIGKARLWPWSGKDKVTVKISPRSSSRCRLRIDSSRSRASSRLVSVEFDASTATVEYIRQKIEYWQSKGKIQQ